MDDPTKIWSKHKSSALTKVIADAFAKSKKRPDALCVRDKCLDLKRAIKISPRDE